MNDEEESEDENNSCYYQDIKNYFAHIPSYDDKKNGAEFCCIISATLGGTRQSINFSESHINVANYSKFKVMLLDMYLSEKPWEKKIHLKKYFQSY